MNRYLTEKRKDFCCGCNACAEKCPTQCIQMKIDSEGFSYPEIIDINNCVNCDICAKVCPLEQVETSSNTELNAVAGYSLNDDILIKSSSGGIFTEISKVFLENEGVVFGAALDENNKLFHIPVESFENIYKLQGSKYIQSNINGVFSSCKKELESGKKVLFTGTPCQISALNKFLNKQYDNLYTVDVICHGVPSQKIFDAYVEYLENKHQAQLVDISFRDKKKNGWSITLRYTMKYKNGNTKDYYLISPMSEYFTGFLGGYISRESCYQCPYSSLNRPSDITMGDFWGYQKTRPELVNNKGLSILLINTEKGKELFNILKNKGLFFSEVTENSIRMSENKNLYKPTVRPKERDDIYLEFNKYGFEYIAKKYLQKYFTFRNKIKNTVPKKYWKYL